MSSKTAGESDLHDSAVPDSEMSQFDEDEPQRLDFCSIEMDLNRLISNSHNQSLNRLMHLSELKNYMMKKCDQLMTDSESWDKDK